MTQRPSSGRQPGVKTSEEGQLLEAVRRRDRRAFAELYRLYHPRLHRYLRRLLSSPAMIEEIVDDVLFVVWEDARKFRGKSAVSSWIFGIAYRKAMSAIRKESRYQALLDRSVDTDNAVAQSPPDNELILAGLTELSPDHRQVVELAYFCGMSYQEIAEVANCPVNTVKTRMFHARRRLKLLLPELAGGAKEMNRDHA